MFHSPCLIISSRRSKISYLPIYTKLGQLLFFLTIPIDIINIGHWIDIFWFGYEKYDGKNDQFYHEDFSDTYELSGPPFIFLRWSIMADFK